MSAFGNWVSGVAKSGTFHYNGSDTTTGASAIPTGWTVSPWSVNGKYDIRKNLVNNTNSSQYIYIRKCILS